MSSEWRWSEYDAPSASAQQSHAGDAAKRLHILNEAETLMLNEAPILPVYWYTHSYLMRPEVTYRYQCLGKGAPPRLMPPARYS